MICINKRNLSTKRAYLFLILLMTLVIDVTFKFAQPVVPSNGIAVALNHLRGVTIPVSSDTLMNNPVDTTFSPITIRKTSDEVIVTGLVSAVPESKLYLGINAGPFKESGIQLPLVQRDRDYSYSVTMGKDILTLANSIPVSLTFTLKTPKSPDHEIVVEIPSN